MPALVAGMHVLRHHKIKNVNGRDKPADGKSVTDCRRWSHFRFWGAADMAGHIAGRVPVANDP